MDCEEVVVYRTESIPDLKDTEFHLVEIIEDFSVSIQCCMCSSGCFG